MAAAELLDYNQIQEQSPTTGDSLPTSGGPVIWQFRADPNLAWDPSQSFFAMDVTVKSYGGSLTTSGALNAATKQDFYLPGGADLRPFFPLRCFSQASHVIDGVTVASSTHPYLDKIIQEKYLHETTVSNYDNFESLQLARAIDDGIKEHNIFRALGAGNFTDLYEQGWTIRALEQYDPSARAGEKAQNVASISISSQNAAEKPGEATTLITKSVAVQTAQPTHTILFQPPFDFWTKHQRVSGGNHQVTLNLRPPDSNQGYGILAGTPCTGINFQAAAAAMPLYDYFVNKGVATDKSADTSAATANTNAERLSRADSGLVPAALHAQAIPGIANDGEHGAQFLGQGESFDAILYRNFAAYTRGIHMQINRIRLLRRVVRFTIERPIATQEYNLTEMQLYVGQAAGQGTSYNASSTSASRAEINANVTQNFLLPSSTFGLIFYWRDASNEQFDVIGDFPEVKLIDQTHAGHSTNLCNGPDSATIIEAHKKFALNNFFFTYGGETYPSQRINNITQKSGVDGTPFGYEKLQTISNQLMGSYNMPMEYINTSFAKHGLLERLDGHMFFFPVAKHSNSDNSDLQVQYEAKVGGNYPSGVTLCVVALYDARIELSYNSANQLEKVTKTEWK